jgi:hypothetical protein
LVRKFWRRKRSFASTGIRTLDPPVRSLVAVMETYNFKKKSLTRENKRQCISSVLQNTAVRSLAREIQKPFL